MLIMRFRMASGDLHDFKCDDTEENRTISIEDAASKSYDSFSGLKTLCLQGKIIFINHVESIEFIRQ